MNYGIIIMRAQPFHMGHISVVREILSQNDRALIVVGSANKSGTKRNPLSIEDRISIVNEALKDQNLSDRVLVMPLSDWSMENAYAYVKEWGCFLYYNVVNAIRTKEFTIYYNDDKSIVENWFNETLMPRITIKNTPRGSIDVSGTQIRDALLNPGPGSDDYLKFALSPSTYAKKDYIKEVILNSNDEDFIMK